jgi:ABC-2 type transport system permease protein
MATSIFALALLPPLFGQPESVVRLLACLPVLLIVGLASHFYGAALGSIMLRFPQLNWLVLNVGYLLVMTFAGVHVPPSFWPAPLRLMAQVLPVTHGLAAVRGILAGASPAAALGSVLLELAVSAGWLVLGWLAYSLVVKDARRLDH